MNAKKWAILITTVALAVSLTIGGTLAYLTSTQSATNTFTVGNVQIGLSEPNWNNANDGKNMLPGNTYNKDPLITAIQGKSYMRVKLEVRDTATGNLITDPARLALILSTIYTDPTYNVSTGTPGTNIVKGQSYSASAVSTWQGINSSKFTLDAVRSVANSGIYYYNYTTNGGIFDSSASNKVVLFSNVVVPTDFTNSQIALLGSYSFTLTSQAIQSDNIASAAAAYTALDSAI